jgi:hypothetical protein
LESGNAELAKRPLLEELGNSQPHQLSLPKNLNQYKVNAKTLLTFLRIFLGF